jgi:Prokaryotic Cytochrome C oxidase subunit IV
MPITLNKRLALVWLILALLTLCYLWIDRSGDHGGVLHPSVVVTVAAIVIALVKVRIIFREFMEVRHAPVWLGRLTDLWVLLIAIGLMASYLVGTALR